MDNANEMIKSVLGTAIADPAAASTQTNPAMKNIATNGKLVIQNIGELAKALTTLKKTWGG